MSPPIWVFAVGGLPGSGKSTFGRAMAVAVGGALLDNDTLTNPLMARIAALTGAGDDLDHPSLRGPVRDARYDCLRDTAAEVAGVGCSVVLVAPFTAELADPVAWQRFSAPLRMAGVTGVFLVQTLVEPATALRRRAARGQVRDRKLQQGRVPGLGPVASAAAAAAAGTAGTAGASVVRSAVADLFVDGTADAGAEAARVLAELEFGRV